MQDMAADFPRSRTYVLDLADADSSDSEELTQDEVRSLVEDLQATVRDLRKQQAEISAEVYKQTEEEKKQYHSVLLCNVLVRDGSP